MKALLNYMNLNILFKLNILDEYLKHSTQFTYIFLRSQFQHKNTTLGFSQNFPYRNSYIGCGSIYEIFLAKVMQFCVELRI